MEVFKEIINAALSCFQWRVPIIGCTMWQAEIALAVGGIIAASISEMFEE